MTEHRPFPPSPRRLALARQSGLTAASPVLVGAIAWIAAVIAAVFLARAAADLAGSWIAAACDGRAILDPSGVARAVLELAAPVLIAAAIAAIVGHVAQTRAVWLPRRRIPGAPVVPQTAGPRTSRAAIEIIAAIVIGGVTFAWLWTTAPRLAALIGLDPTSMLAGTGSALGSLMVSLAIAWVALATFDALMRRVELARALAMTATEKREDDRLSAADPRWRAHRAALARGPSISDAVAAAAVIVLGDDVAIAIAWDARRQPVPLRTASGRRARATQLIGLARRHQIPVHRDAELAAALVDGEGPIPDAQWSRLAEVIAAVRGRS